MPRDYQQDGLVLARGDGSVSLVRALQQDLRCLGYLPDGIDGVFGGGTAAAIRALQYDLINPPQAHGEAPIRIADFNQNGGVTTVTGVLDQALAGCIAALLAAPGVDWVPRSDDPAGANRAALRQAEHLTGVGVPMPFLLAMFVQESNCQHFQVPTGRSSDDFVTIGLDRNIRDVPDQITSRGYGMGQFTIFHHPPTPAEVRDFIVDAVGNLQKAIGELRAKFDNFVVGPADRADDRTAEHPGQALRTCKYTAEDPRYLSDCRACAVAAPSIDIHQGTPAYQGAGFGYQPDQYYPSAEYAGEPDRAGFACDWPYAARRYNGSGNNSFHYQTRILRNLAAGPAAADG